MKTFNADNLDQDTASARLKELGHVVIEGMLAPKELKQISRDVNEICARERETPFDPSDDPSSRDDAAIEAYMTRTYKMSDAELARIMRRIRHTRAQNHGTPWPVATDKMNKSFLHMPTLFDYDKSQ